MLGTSRRRRSSSLSLLLAAGFVAVSLCSSFASAQVSPAADGAPKTNDSRDQAILPPTEAEPVAPRAGEALSFTAGFDATSHFISFGADVWGGGSEAFPFTSDATHFAYGTVTAKFTDELSGFVNVWTDLNNNVDSAIGGWFQEIDLNVGVNYAWNGFTFGFAHNYWVYAGDEEYAVEASVGYSDADMWKDTWDGFALNPSFLAHYRYQGQTGQDESFVLQAGVRPSFTFMAESKYPVTVALPAAVAFFTDGYQGGDAGFAYANAGIALSVPLAFIPVEYGNWSAGVSASYWHTDKDAIPNNPQDNFVVTAVSVNVAF